MLRFGVVIINWKVDELKKMDITTRKTLTMYVPLIQRMTLMNYI